jgi:hypothetical protein
MWPVSGRWDCDCEQTQRGSELKELLTALQVRIDYSLLSYVALFYASAAMPLREDLVGEALRELETQHGIPRESLWVQTK